jgi:hypothetical protein
MLMKKDITFLHSSPRFQLLFTLLSLSMGDCLPVSCGNILGAAAATSDAAQGGITATALINRAHKFSEYKMACL